MKRFVVISRVASFSVTQPDKLAGQIAKAEYQFAVIFNGRLSQGFFWLFVAIGGSLR